jgi:dihydropteroate synthase
VQREAPRAFRLMGILNVTPDSFSDGGRYLDAVDAIARGAQLAGEGAAIVDVGGESTRLGAEPVGADEELRRVLPVIEGLSALELGVRLSVDTYKAQVARAALAAGASLVNDVSALRADAQMAALIAASGADCCLMHARGEPRAMHAAPVYDDVVDEVKAFLAERLEFAVREGIAPERILLDPGIGFGKRERHNLELLRRLDEIAALGRPVVVGTSRKRFLGRIAARAAGSDEPLEPSRRLAGTVASNVLAFERGASVFRVHDVAPLRDALAVADATLGGRCTPTGAGTTAAN